MGAAVLLLHLRNMEKTTVGCMEESNSERKPDAHKEILYIVCENDRHSLSDGVDDLAKDPVGVKQNYG